MRWALPLVGLITIIAAAQAHVAPSVDDNNRYLKVTPQADRVRVAYTVFFGEVPGKAMRPSLDRDKDGAISDGEAQTFGDKLAADVLAAMESSVDGKQQRLAWKAVSVGMGSPSTTAGAFSIDMIAYLCLSGAHGRHTFTVRDRFRVPNPGETEVLVEDGLGIKLEHARIGTATAVANDFKFVGPGGPLSDDGLDVAFAAESTAPLSNDGECVAAPMPPSGPGGGRIPIVAVVIGVVVAIGVALAIIMRRRRRGSRQQ